MRYAMIMILFFLAAPVMAQTTDMANVPAEKAVNAAANETVDEGYGPQDDEYYNSDENINLEEDTIDDDAAVNTADDAK